MRYILSGLAILAAQEVFAAPAIVERSSSGIPVSDNTATLAPVNGTTPSSQALHDSILASGAPLSSLGGEAYSVTTNLGGASFPLLFDTGSSDLWVAQTSYQCLGPNGKPKPASYCDLGPKFSGKYTGGQIKGKKFFIQYGTGEVYGSLGFESVTVAGINVAKQEISSAIKGYFQGAGASGIFGFAYNDLTSQYPGKPGTKANPAQNEPYTNWISNAISQKKFSPLFTVVLERGNGASSLTLGGVPSAYSGLSYASTPIQIKKITPIKGEATHYSYYTITPQGISINGASTSTSTPAIVDTGTTLLYLPAAQAQAVAAGFTPPATLDSAAGVYIVPCSAKAPKFGVEIGGKTFFVSSQDLLIPANKAGTVCVTGVQSSGTSGFSILGDVFLKNVIAVFDRGAEEMKFAQHTY